MSDEKLNLPYGCDYARTGRSNCKGKDCENTHIPEGDLRICARRKSSQHKGIMEIWFHFDCFWKQSRKGLSEAEMVGFENLRWDDQERCRAKMKSRDENPDVKNRQFKNAEVDYSNSAKSACEECRKRIRLDELRIKYRSNYWHPECLSGREIYKKKGEEIDGFAKLSDSNRDKLCRLFTGLTNEEIEKEYDVKLASRVDQLPLEELKRAREFANKGPELDQLNVLIERKEALKKQSDLIWQVRDQIEEAILTNDQIRSARKKKSFLADLIEQNSGHPHPKSTASDYIQFLADLVVFGGFKECPKCGNPNFFYNKDLRQYQCVGLFKESCFYQTRQPKRQPFEAGDFEALREYDGKQLLPQGRLFNTTIEEGAEKSRMVEMSQPFKRVDPSRKRKPEPEGLMKNNGFSVDPNFKEAENFHVYVDGKGNPYQFLLHKLDKKSGEQQFYKMQLLQQDNGNEWHLFRRYGTVLAQAQPKNQINKFGSKDQALKEFKRIFEQKTGLNWDKDRQKDFKSKDTKGGYELVEWNTNMTGTYGRASTQSSNDKGAKKVKKEEEVYDENEY